MVALLFNVNTKLYVSFFDKLNENSRQQASSCKWEEACFLLMYNVEFIMYNCHAEGGMRRGLPCGEDNFLAS